MVYARYQILEGYLARDTSGVQRDTEVDNLADLGILKWILRVCRGILR